MTLGQRVSGLRVPNLAWLDAWGCRDEGSIQGLGQAGSRRAPELLGGWGLGWVSTLQRGGQGSRLLAAKAEVRKFFRGTLLPPSHRPRLSRGTTGSSGKSWHPSSLEAQGLGGAGVREAAEDGTPASVWLAESVLSGRHVPFKT